MYPHVRGEILYAHDRNGVTGREWFDITTYPDGSQTMRFVCEMDDDALVRDVVYTRGPDALPRDCFVRVTQHARLVGSSWFWFAADEMLCEGFNSETGRISQRIALQRPLRAFAAHPVYMDGLTAGCFDHANPARRQRLDNCAHSSSAENGGTGPELHPATFDVEWLGDTTCILPAGTFAARAYLIHLPDYADPLQVWLEPGTGLFLKLVWPVLEARYELVSLSR